MVDLPCEESGGTEVNQEVEIEESAIQRDKELLAYDGSHKAGTAM